MLKWSIHFSWIFTFQHLYFNKWNSCLNFRNFLLRPLYKYLKRMRIVWSLLYFLIHPCNENYLDSTLFGKISLYFPTEIGFVKHRQNQSNKHICSEFVKYLLSIVYLIHSLNISMYNLLTFMLPHIAHIVVCWPQLI